MFDFVPDHSLTKPRLYADMLAAVDAVTTGETDAIANMANVAALLSEFLPDCNWVGFYRLVGQELVLGPFAGRPACSRIPLGTGVCGVAAQGGITLLVNDVHAFPGHIACDARSRAELVVPIERSGQVIGVLDIDSPTPGRFDEEDRAGIEQLAKLLAPRL